MITYQEEIYHALMHHALWELCMPFLTDFPPTAVKGCALEDLILQSGEISDV